MIDRWFTMEEDLGKLELEIFDMKTQMNRIEMMIDDMAVEEDTVSINYN
jgi:hypothetical protein